MPSNLTPHKTLHIAIDGNEANTPNRVGSNVYAFKLLEALYSITQLHPEITVTVLSSSETLEDLPAARSDWKYVVIPPAKFWTQWALPIHLFIHKKNYDIFFTPGHYAPRLCPIPYVSSVMDTAYLEYPDQFNKTDTLKLTKWTAYSVQNAEKVIAISEFTKSSVVSAYGKNPNDVVVAYPGTNVSSFKISDSFRKKTLRKFKIRQPYLLFVGTLQPRKNIETLIEAYETFVRLAASRTLPTKGKRNVKQPTPQLVLAGKVGWLATPILKRIADSVQKKNIITTGFITNKEKQVLYEEAFASTLLGLYEGFGIPPLESFYYGTPTVVSNTTSLPEVVGDAGLQVDPRDPHAAAEAFYDIYSATARQKLVWKRRGIKQTKQFSWEDSANKVLETLIQTHENLSK
ncbi:MAG: glycosyltransferase family 4 protein [Pseudomonadales bacterium]|nr:glycosyltransferase family 4 protein [Candidatus Woesebacteria bacterium]MCB9800798.1 glycosyltransferase family 4 protein [Pseudomonadales bacterium]